VMPSTEPQRFTGVLPERASYILLDILETAGVEVHATNSFRVTTRSYPAGTIVITLNQPYAGFARALLIPRLYPDLRDASGRPIPPYDVTAHTLSLLMNVQVDQVLTPFRYSAMKTIQTGLNGGCGDASNPPRAAYKSSVAAIDEGWTRWVLDKQQCTGYHSVGDKEIRTGHLYPDLETIVIPDQPRAAILNGHRKGTMPEEYTGGLGEQSVKALREFVEAGDTLVCLNRASDFAIEQFKVPVREV